jgi:hypothetical protein
MTLLTCLLGTLIIAEPAPLPADPNAWEYTCDQKIVDTQLVQTESTRLLAMLHADHALTLLDVSNGRVVYQSRLFRPLLRFATQLAAPGQTAPDKFVLCSLGGCLLVTVGLEGKRWSINTHNFITMIDAGIAKADPEFHDRLLETWQRGEQLITLTRMGRLASYDHCGNEPKTAINLGPIGAHCWAASPEQLALAWKQGSRVSLILLDLVRFQPFLIASLPEATIPRRLKFDQQTLRAHYPNRRYELPLLPRFPDQPACLSSLSPFENPYSTLGDFQPKHDFDPAIQRHTLPKATIAVYDHRIVLRRTN